MPAPLRATFFAFRKREPRVLLRATLTHVALGLALIAILVAAFWIYANRGPRDAVTATQEGWVMFVATVVWAVICSLITASFEAACLRQILRGEKAGFAGLSLGADTWRVWAGHWIWLLFAIASFVGAIVVTSLTTAAVGFSTPATAAWTGFLAIGLWIVVLSPFALRMSAGNAASIAKRRFAYFDAWAVTSGRFRTLSGSFLTIWAIVTALYAGVIYGVAFLAAFVVADSLDDGLINNFVMSTAFLLALCVSTLSFLFLAAGVNARAVIAAGEEGKIAGVASGDIASVFD